MDFVQSLVLGTALVPVVVSTIVAAVFIRFRRLSPVAGAVALAVAFFAGWATQSWATLFPSRYLDWFPYAAVLLGLVTVISVDAKMRIFWPLVIAACAGSAWLIVPDFPRLQPPRPHAMALVASACVLLVFALEPLTHRVNPRLFVLSCMATATSAAIVLQQSFTMKFAQIAGMIAAGMTGALLFTHRPPLGEQVTGAQVTGVRQTRGLALVFAPLICNLMFVGYATSTSEVPLFCYAVIPVALLPLWAVAYRSDSVSQTRACTAIGVIGVAVILVLAVYLALMAHPPWEDNIAVQCIDSRNPITSGTRNLLAENVARR